MVDWLAADDVCGIAPASSAGEWLATTGRGHVLALRVDGDTLRPRPIAGPTEVRWDNHLS